MENQIIVKNNFVPAESEFSILQTVARNASSSGLYAGVGSEQKIFMVLLAARELGVPPMMALNGGLWNIQGKIELSARLMNSLIRKAGHSIKILHCDDQKCVIEGKRLDNGDTFTAQFTIEDAKRAGLAGRSNWKIYAEDMLYSRAMSRLARRLFPDVIGTCYVEGEIRDSKMKKFESEKSIDFDETFTAEQEEEKISEFLLAYPEEEHKFIRLFLQKYSEYWAKSICKSIEDYADTEKFLRDFEKWKKKQK